MQLNSDYYDTDFEIIYKGNKILIRNDGPEGESLFINDELQDQNFSAHNGQLIGHIFDEENNKEVIEVILAGKETRDCLIYANGNLIHSHVPQEEFIEDREITEKVKKKNNLFFPFLMIILIAVCTIFLLPYLDRSEPSEEPADDTVDTVDTTFQEDIAVDYAWNYGEGSWTYELKIPKSSYEYYKTVDRKKIKNYSYYVTDPSDDEYLAGLAEKFKEAAENENFSDLDMVKKFILFVHRLS